MKKLSLLLFFVTTISFSQTKESIELCMIAQSTAFSSNVEAENALQRILNTVGLKKNFVLSPCSEISNAIAVSYKGVRYILYDNDFLNQLDYSSNDWFGITVLAHEVGHHVNGHSVDIVLALGDVVESKSLDKRRSQELEADEFAGFVLSKLGAPMDKVIANISSISTDADDSYSTHPSRSKRVNAIRAGYANAGGEIVQTQRTQSSYEERQRTSEIDIYSIEYPVYTMDEQKTSNYVNSAITNNSNKNFKQAGKQLELAYQYCGELDYIYYAASSYVNGGDYRAALKPYLYLFKKAYEGTQEKYYLTAKTTGKEVEVSEAEYNNLINNKKFYNPRIEITESKYPEIVKNIALIYAQLGEKEKGLQFVSYARAENPFDLNLILTEANFYIQTGETEKFEILMNEAISQDPNNPSLYFNLGVVNAQKGNVSSAKRFYEKAIDLDPKFESGYLNLVSLILAGEEPIVNEMNNLGNSQADNARYDLLKAKRESIYRQCVPILEKLISINRNYEAILTLKNIYGTLGDKKGFSRMEKLIK